jgi:hypothetical protein
VIGRIISMNQVLELAHKGYRQDLIEGAITMLQQDIAMLMAGLTFDDKTQVIEDYQEQSDWIQFVAGSNQ